MTGEGEAVTGDLVVDGGSLLQCFSRRTDGGGSPVGRKKRECGGETRLARGGSDGGHVTFAVSGYLYPAFFWKITLLTLNCFCFEDSGLFKNFCKLIPSLSM